MEGQPWPELKLHGQLWGVHGRGKGGGERGRVARAGHGGGRIGRMGGGGSCTRRSSVLCCSVRAWGSTQEENQEKREKKKKENGKIKGEKNWDENYGMKRIIFVLKTWSKIIK
jgi:hypothetical protein